MINFDIKPLSTHLTKDLQKKIDLKIKPLGSLGKLEKIALQIGRIQNTLSPKLKKMTMLVFAGDHGINEEGVSAFPQEVTYQMVKSFLSGGGGISVFTKQHGIDIKVVDAGVKYDFDPHPNIIISKIAKSTKNFLYEPAMTKKQCFSAIEKGAEIVKNIHKNDCNIVGFGEMGVSNTSPSSVILSILCDIPIEDCVGKGGGICHERLSKKRKILKQAINNNKKSKEPLDVLITFGGFEIAMMTGAMLKAAELKMTLVIDGFINTSALLLASRLYPNIIDYCIFSHKSNEKAHINMLKELNVDPLLDLGLRLGEGTGAAISYPLIESAVIFLNEMASYEDGTVSNVIDQIPTESYK